MAVPIVAPDRTTKMSVTIIFIVYFMTGERESPLPEERVG
jgi:hypothetical protein